jgi:peptidoglycan/xylan/chitin deacetylase (PgdA/CDA1 family)
MHLALKVDVDTYRGTREGVPALLRTLDKHGTRATFLFSLGPDHTGRALKRAFRPGFLKKVQRTSVVEHYGIKTLLYGVLLPGPHIGRKCRAEMRAVRDAGHEVGIHTYDHVRWQDGVSTASPAWTERELKLAFDSFREVFDTPAKVHGAAGWQMNATAFELTEQLGFDYASDTRGRAPFLPKVGTRVIRCPQLPTTLPTLDELMGVTDLQGGTPVTHLRSLTEKDAPKGHAKNHVYTLHAELEGMKLQPMFDELLSAWRSQGWTLGALADSFRALDRSSLPVCHVQDASLPGRSGVLASQGSLA